MTGMRSLSKLPLLPHCLYLFRDDVVHPPELARDDSSRGTARHRAIAAGLLGTLATADLSGTGFEDPWGLGDDPCLFAERVRAWVLEQIAPHPTHAARLPKLLVEQGVAYNPVTDTARLGPGRADDGYPWARAGEICGTVDLAWSDAVHVEIIDWKCGEGLRFQRRSYLQQLRGLSLAFARALGCSTARARTFAVDDQAICSLLEEHQADAQELDAIAYDLGSIGARAAGSSATPGDHCRMHFCPLLGSCPATIEMVSLVVHDTMPAPAAAYPLTPTPLSPAHLAYLLEVKEALKAWLQRFDGASKAMADAGPVVLPDGRTFGKVLSPSESIEWSDAVRKVLEEEGLSVAVGTSTSKSAIEKAARAHAPRGHGAAVVRRVLERLRAVGAMKQGMKSTYEVT